ncbi:hypothetical protein ACA373_18765 [Erwinia sp. STN24]|uniref:hypothetical protein n=1 Tax=Erwinia sp. STN24 TaxID=3233996 RepID=UPI00351FAFA4
MKINLIFIILLALFYTFLCTVNAQVEFEHVRFIGGAYNIYINDSDCQVLTDCKKVKAEIVDKGKKEKYSVFGETITTGFGRNLRGYNFYRGNYKYEISRPETRLNNQSDLSKWVLTIYKKNGREGFNKIFSEEGEMNI